jgi:hypothetical protein
MAAEFAKIHEKLGIKLDAPLRRNVQLNHPSADAVGIKLFVPRSVQGVCEVHATAIATDLDHLRAAVQGFAWLRDQLR